MVFISKGEKGKKDKRFENVTCYHQKGRDAISLFKASSVAKEVYMLNGPLLQVIFYGRERLRCNKLSISGMD